ncbi:MAG: hypothetical protein L6416_08490 [Candidatus Omnitrophica bacterium]|nr:hypothetical protein [Candidatus Omnitrophota bacterium]
MHNTKFFIKKEKARENLAVFFLVIAILIFTLPLMFNIDKAFTFYQKNCANNFQDLYFNGFFYRNTILNNNQLPLWMPFREGGAYGVGIPGEISLNPLSICILIFGVIKGFNLSWYILYIIGGLSMYYLTRFVLKFNLLGALYSSVVFSMNAFFPLKQLEGFIYARETILLPLLIAFFIKSQQKNKYIFFTALILSLFFIQTGLYFCVVMLLLFFITTFESIKVGRNNEVILKKRYFIVISMSLILALLLSLQKLFPLLETMRINLEISGAMYKSTVLNTLSLSEFFEYLTIPKNFESDTMYVGYLPVLLCLFSGIIYFKKMRNWLFMLFIFIILSLGPNPFYDLHYFLSYLPGFRSIIESAKYYALVIIFLISLISGAFFLLLTKKSSKLIKFLFVVLLVLTYGDLLWANSRYFNFFKTEIIPKVQHSSFFQVQLINVNKDDVGTQSVIPTALYQKGIGSIDYTYVDKKRLLDGDGIPEIIKKEIQVTPKYFLLPQYAFLIPKTGFFFVSNAYYNGEAFFLSAQNKMKSLSITPNVIKIRVEVAKPDYLIINQNYSKWWRSDNFELKNYKGRIAIFVNKLGNNEILIYFMPINFYGGLVISIFVLIMSVWIFFKKDFSRKTYYYVEEKRCKNVTACGQ